MFLWYAITFLISVDIPFDFELKRNEATGSVYLGLGIIISVQYANHELTEQTNQGQPL